MVPRPPPERIHPLSFAQVRPLGLSTDLHGACQGGGQLGGGEEEEKEGEEGGEKEGNDVYS